MVLKLFVVTGCIGVGKSTVNKHLDQYWKECLPENKHSNYLILGEAIKDWQRYLDAFYENINSKTAFEMQLICFFHFFNITNILEELERDSKTHVVVVERSLLDSRKIFIENLKSVLEERHLEILDKFCTEYIEHKIWKNATHIYLRCTDIDQLYKRVESYDRGHKITKDYLSNINKLYEEYFGVNADHIIDTTEANETQVFIELLKIIDN